MTKAVFIASSHSGYLDRPGELYHFPNSYLSRVERTVGDWVVFFEGRRGGSRGYYGVQRVARIEADPVTPGHSFAILDRASELSFERNVARLKADGAPYETGLPLSRGSNTSSVRLISEADFALIVQEGLRADDVADALPREGALPTAPGLSDPAAAWEAPSFNVARALVPSNRAFRERSFARQVKRAYGARCAMSGLELRNGGGRPEVEAAHIVPVEAQGPDTVRNGLALSGTLHWMFDRGLLSVDGDGGILTAEGSIAHEVADRLLTPDRRLILPGNPLLRPHPAYLQWHRENCFKG
jgi:putative restriction endonuclease